MLIVGRSGWNAGPPEHEPTRIPMPTPRLWIHHTAGSERGASGMRAIQHYHQDTKGWNDIAYSFVIDPDGTVYEGRGAGIAGAHTEGDNSRSHAICVMGNYETDLPSVAVLNSIVELAAYGRDKGWWAPTLGGHRDAPGAQTKCPGQHLYAQLTRLKFNVDNYQEDPFDMTPTERKKFIDDISTAAALKAVAAIEQRLSTRGVPMRVKLRELAKLGATDALVEADEAAEQAAASFLGAMGDTIGLVTGSRPQPEPEPETAAKIVVPDA